MGNLYDYPVSERKKKFEESLNELPQDSPISTEDMIRELAIMRKGYYNPHDWGFAEDNEKKQSNKT